MDHTGFLTGNLTLDLAILAWFAAQVLKTLLHWVTNRNLDRPPSDRSAAGGIPCFPCRRPSPWW